MVLYGPDEDASPLKFFAQVAWFVAEEVWHTARLKLFPPVWPISAPWDPRYQPTPEMSRTPASKQDAKFLNLPLEIRLAIYEYILAPQKFHLSANNDLAPLNKYKCLYPQFHADSVHGECHGHQWAQELLKLSLICRQTRDEALPMLYQNTWLMFSQPVSFLRVFDALPSDLRRCMRHMSYPKHITIGLIEARPSSLEEWNRCCTFWSEHFGPNFNLHLRASLYRTESRRIRHPESEKEVDWLKPLLALGRRIQLWLEIPSGDSGAFYGDFETRRSNREQQTEMMSKVIDVSEMVRRDVQEEETIADLQRQIQAALWEWKPYGRLVGDD